MRTNLVTYLDDFLAREGETGFAHRRGLRVARWSYSQMAATAFQFARELEARHIGKGERVLLCADNGPEWVASFFGCLLRGAIVVPLDVQSDLAFVARVQEQVSAKLALCDSKSRGLMPNLAILNLEALSALIAHHSSSRYEPTDIAQDDTVEIVFTSGTTAEPKGVRLTHRNLLANLLPLEQEISPYLKWERLVHPVRFLNLLPLSHVFGQLMGAFVPPLLGGEVFFQESLSPAQIVQTVKRERVSVLITVPRILDALRAKIESDYEARGQRAQFQRATESARDEHFTLRWWRFRRLHRLFGWKFWAFVSGGATLNTGTEEFWRRLGFAVIQGYGMTETASLISVNHPFKAGRGSIGRVMPGQKVKLAANGEILVRGANVSPGYWDAARQQDGETGEGDDARPGQTDGESTAEADDGWFHTGDVGELDDLGNLYFKGRKKEVIVTAAGLNVYPEDIERVLDQQPNVVRSVVVEFEGAHGPEPLAVLILRDQRTNARAVVERANQYLGSYQQVHHWFVWPGEDFPRTATQKIRKRLVAEKARAELASASVPSVTAPDSEPLAEIVSRVSDYPFDRLDPAAQLGNDLKLDSLGRVELLSALEDRYQIEIDEAAFTDVTTIAEVDRLVREGKGLTAAAPYPYPRWQQRWPLSWLRLALLYLIVLPATRLLGWPRIMGREQLHDFRGPLVLICNHVTMTDHALVLLALPARFRNRVSIAQDGELLRGWRHPPSGTALLTRLLDLLQYLSIVIFFNVFAMPQKSGFRRSFDFAGEMIDRGYNLLIFPEGQRTKHGAMNPFMPGTGLLIQQLNVPVVPVRIDGLWQLKQMDRHFARPGEVSVTIGKPVRYSQTFKPEAIARDLEQRVKAL